MRVTPLGIGSAAGGVGRVSRYMFCGRTLQVFELSSQRIIFKASFTQAGRQNSGRQYSSMPIMIAQLAMMDEEMTFQIFRAMNNCHSSKTSKRASINNADESVIGHQDVRF